MFYKSEDFISACKKENKHLWNFVLEEEKEHTGLSCERIKKKALRNAQCYGKFLKRYSLC